MLNFLRNLTADVILIVGLIIIAIISIPFLAVEVFYHIGWLSWIIYGGLGWLGFKFIRSRKVEDRE